LSTSVDNDVFDDIVEDKGAQTGVGGVLVKVEHPPGLRLVGPSFEQDLLVGDEGGFPSGARHGDVVAAPPRLTRR